MSNDLTIPMKIEGGEIQVKASVGQTVIKVVAPEHYLGPFEVFPSDEDQILPVKEKMPVEDIVVKAEEWDGTLFPVTDETDPLYESKAFNGKWVHVYEGDTVIVEGYGRGRWIGFRGLKTVTTQTMPGTVNINVRSGTQFDYLRLRFDVLEECYAVLAGYNSTPDGGHSANAGYCFCGDYLRWKVIHAS